jgi:rhamnosyltransferase
MTVVSRVSAIVVTYHPDVTHLEMLIPELCAQFEEVIIVDNGTADSNFKQMMTAVSDRVLVVLNNENLGIGAAQNIGIKKSLSKGVTHVIVFDQDSMVSPSFRKHLMEAEEALKQMGVGVAAVGPKLIDQATGNIIPFVTFTHGFKRRLSVTAPEQVVECFSLLSSGTLMSRESLEAVGLMREDLFLEYVDVEWGARARLRGLRSYGVAAATLFHNLGDQRLRIGPVIIPLHSPLRHYYTMRNAVAMQKHPAFPFYWKLYDIVRTVRGFILFSCVNPPRLKQAKYMLRGLYHGVIGKSGPFPGK